MSKAKAAEEALKAALAQEHLLELYFLKLEEEANYFKTGSPTEEEFCACPKCQVCKLSLYMGEKLL